MNETVADIVKEKREQADKIEHDAGHNVRMFADQIDKAILFRKWR